ncbi:hypothetical protein E2986_11907 [Frieseomelitta varia]|uniref:Uncharacterized protein n=1 Tax=Frieseomelitta varia TaxID=561572 RepID=A0A833RWK0_9HYME|nr:hypothetical protein E2986_11907 [Frieseomelitta varia]
MSSCCDSSFVACSFVGCRTRSSGNGCVPWGPYKRMPRQDHYGEVCRKDFCENCLDYAGIYKKEGENTGIVIIDRFSSLSAKVNFTHFIFASVETCLLHFIELHCGINVPPMHSDTTVERKQSISARFIGQTSSACKRPFEEGVGPSFSTEEQLGNLRLPTAIQYVDCILDPGGDSNLD